MHIPLALLADYALAHPTDGKLYVTGGGIRSLPFADFPAIQPHLALALGIEVDRSEFGSEHSLTVEAVGPKPGELVKPVTVTFSLPAPSALRSNAPDYFHFVANMENVAFEGPGEYSFIVTIDHTEYERVKLRVVKRTDVRPAPEAATQVEVNSLLNQGFEAFGRGDLGLAEATFRQLTTQFPTVSGGHNNLGFVLLAKGDASGALSQFALAKKLGYPQDEISDANTGVALYQAGDALAAQRLFATCLESRMLRTTAVLFGINASGLFPVQLNSAGDYAALMSLNAAWSAHKAGDQPAADEFAAAARAGLLAFRNEPDRGRFEESLKAVEETGRIAT